MNQINKFFFGIAFLICSVQANAQWEVNVPLNYAHTLTELTEADYKNGFGGGFSLISSSFTSRYSNTKIQMGVEFDFMNARSNKVNLDLSEPQNGIGRYKLTNKHNGIALFTRFGWDVAPKVRLFSDVLIGTRNFKTTSKLSVLYDLTNEYDDVVQRIEKHGSFRYGGAVGFRIKLSRVIGITSRVQYNNGGKADFIDLNSLAVNNTNQPNYTSLSIPKSPLLIYSFGFNIIFDKKKNASKGNPNYSPAPRSNNRTISPSERRAMERERRINNRRPVKPRPPAKKKPKVKRGSGGNN